MINRLSLTHPVIQMKLEEYDIQVVFDMPQSSKRNHSNSS